jgi:hypothetical protein
MIKAFIVLIACALLSGCAYNRNFVSWRSDLREVVAGQHTDEDLRARLLELTPLGTSKRGVEAVLRKEFKRGIREKPDLPDNYIIVPGSTSLLCARLKESGHIPIGSNWTEAVWFFNKDDVLIEIVVAQYGVCL